MAANRWILLTLTAGAVLVGCLWQQWDRESRAGESPRSSGRADQEGRELAGETDAAAAQALLQGFIEARESGALPPNSERLMERAREVAELARKAYPYRSLRDRLEYEQQHRPGPEEPKLSPEAAERLERNDARFAMYSTRGLLGDSRAKSLEMLHSEQVAEFIARDGFGRTRLPAPTSPLLWELPPAPTVPLAAGPKLSAEEVGEDTPYLPEEVTRFDLLRLHAGRPDWTEDEVADRYDNQMSHDERMQALFETYATWRAKHNPLNLPSRVLILESHNTAALNFAGSGRNGHVNDVEQVAGFGSHAMTRTPQFEPGPPQLRYWPDATQEAPRQWLVTQLQLVSLLKHKSPAVYVSENLPQMEELEDAPLRPLNEFERAGLERLFAGEELALDVRANRIWMLGALRAGKQCLQCHQVGRGALLGAFSYELVRAQPLNRTQVAELLER